MKRFLILLFVIYSCGKTFTYGQEESQYIKAIIDSLVIKSKQGDLESQYTLGTLLLSGEYVQKNEEQALLWISKAAHKGHPKSEYLYGVMYYEGLAAQKNPELAFYWFDKAAQDNVADAYFYLGMCYREGIGVPKDKQKAISYFRKAANKGISHSFYLLGLSFEEGYGVDKNIDSALYYYQVIEDDLAVLYPDRISELAKMKNGYACYLMGMRDPISLDGLDWFTDAAKLGYPDAYYQLGQMYDFGYISKPNAKEAVNMYKIGAKAGSSECCFELARHYSMGNGVEKDEEQALIWYQKAADGGIEYAKTFLK